MKPNVNLLSKVFVIGLMAVVLISIIGIITMSRTHVVLQGQIEATEIRISGKLPGRVDTFLVVEGQSVKRGDTLVGINSPEAWAKLQQANAMENVAGTSARPTVQWGTMYFRRKMRQVFAERRVIAGDVNAQTETTLLGIRVVKSFGNESIERSKFNKESKRLY